MGHFYPVTPRLPFPVRVFGDGPIRLWASLTDIFPQFVSYVWIESLCFFGIKKSSLNFDTSVLIFLFSVTATTSPWSPADDDAVDSADDKDDGDDTSVVVVVVVVVLLVIVATVATFVVVVIVL